MPFTKENMPWCPCPFKSEAHRLAGHCLGALEMLRLEIYNFLKGFPLTKEKMPWCPCPFKNEAYKPASGSNLYTCSKDKRR